MADVTDDLSPESEHGGRRVAKRVGQSRACTPRAELQLQTRTPCERVWAKPELQQQVRDWLASMLTSRFFVLELSMSDVARFIRGSRIVAGGLYTTAEDSLCRRTVFCALEVIREKGSASSGAAARARMPLPAAGSLPVDTHPGTHAFPDQPAGERVRGMPGRDGQPEPESGMDARLRAVRVAQPDADANAGIRHHESGSLPVDEDGTTALSVRRPNERTVPLDGRRPGLFVLRKRARNIDGHRDGDVDQHPNTGSAERDQRRKRGSKRAGRR